MTDETKGHKVRNSLLAIIGAVGVGGTVASVWWFALKPRRSSKR